MLRHQIRNPSLPDPSLGSSSLSFSFSVFLSRSAASAAPVPALLGYTLFFTRSRVRLSSLSGSARLSSPRGRVSRSPVFTRAVPRGRVHAKSLKGDEQTSLARSPNSYSATIPINQEAPLGAPNEHSPNTIPVEIWSAAVESPCRSISFRS